MPACIHGQLERNRVGTHRELQGTSLHQVEIGDRDAIDRNAIQRHTLDVHVQWRLVYGGND